MTDFSMKLHGVWAILCWNTFLLLYSSRKLQIINAKYKNIEGFKFGYKDIKDFSYKLYKVNDFYELNNTYEKPTGKLFKNAGFINHLVSSLTISYLGVELILF